MPNQGNHVVEMTVTITLASGDQHTLTVHKPGLRGDNPRFLAQQIDSGLGRLGDQLHRVADIYADQLRP